MVDFVLEDAPQDVQNWIRHHEWPAALIPFKSGETFSNSLGNKYYIVEDSPSGEEYVKIREKLPYGYATRYIHKAVLLV